MGDLTPRGVSALGGSEGAAGGGPRGRSAMSAPPDGSAGSLGAGGLCRLGGSNLSLFQDQDASDRMSLTSEGLAPPRPARPAPSRSPRAADGCRGGAGLVSRAESEGFYSDSGRRAGSQPPSQAGGHWSTLRSLVASAAPDFAGSGGSWDRSLTNSTATAASDLPPTGRRNLSRHRHHSTLRAADPAGRASESRPWI